MAASCHRHAAALFLFLLLSAFTLGVAQSEELKSGVFSPPRQAPDFSLKGSDGTVLKLSRFRGKVVALGFGYASCPDICPTTLAQLAEVRKKLGPLSKDFQVVYVTVDPERDDVERMRLFLANYDPTFIGGTGTPEELAALQKVYGITAKQWPIADGKSYLVHHSNFIYLIDGEGKLRAMSPYGRRVDDVVSDVKALMNKG